MQIAPAVWKVQTELKKMLQLEARYVLAVSGGADSLALADAALDVFNSVKGNLLICHVEHGIRGAEALADAELVRRFCAERGATFLCCHVDALTYAKDKGLSLEDAARRLRYEKLGLACQDFGAEAVVTAHQADDQAETVLWKLLRGAGTDGLSGMQTRTKQGKLTLVRPLLTLSRADIEAYCEAKGLKYCQDSTNEDLQYTRNRIRRELLPYLEKNFNSAIKETLTREASLLSETEECLEMLTQQLLQDSELCEWQKDAAVVAAKRLMVQPKALRKRILREIYFRLGGTELSYERTEALAKLCENATGGKLIQLPGGIRAIYEKKKIRIFRSVEND